MHDASLIVASAQRQPNDICVAVNKVKGSGTFSALSSSAASHKKQQPNFTATARDYSSNTSTSSLPPPSLSAMRGPGTSTPPLAAMPLAGMPSPAPCTSDECRR